jgi:hypothetical protein
VKKPSKKRIQTSEEGQWSPVVQYFGEITIWNENGPVGGKPGEWLADQRLAFDEWLRNLRRKEPLTLGRFFARNGKVWGVKGPAFGEKVDTHKGARAFVAVLNIPSHWRCVRVLEKGWIGNDGVARPASEGDFAEWNERAIEAIENWNQIADWVPEIGLLNDKSALGVVPPRDGIPANWKSWAVPVYNEWKLHDENREREAKEKEKIRKAEAKLQDDGLGWMSPKWDDYFKSLEITHDQRKLWVLLQEGKSMHDLLMDYLRLVLNPRSFNFGWGQEAFFGVIKDAFQSSLMVLRWIYTRPNTGSAVHDMHVSKMAAKVLAEHSAEIVAGWKCWEWNNNPRNPKKGNIDDSDPFLAVALAGKYSQSNPDEPNPVNDNWFSSIFNTKLEKPRSNSMRSFVDMCLNRAGYDKMTFTARRKQRVHNAYDERRKQAEEQGAPWLPLVTQEESEILKESDAHELPTYLQMTEEEFSNAWDLNGKKLVQLRKVIEDREKLHSWNSVEFDVMVRGDPLPIKGVMARMLPWLTERMEQMGRTKTTNGKLRNAAAYLSDVEKELHSITREFFGLPRSP